MEKIVEKIIDSTVVVSSLIVGVVAVKGIIGGAKIKSTTAIVISSLTLLIGIYAIKGASTKLNESSTK